MQREDKKENDRDILLNLKKDIYGDQTCNIPEDSLHYH